MATSTDVVTSPLQEMAATTPTDYWNDSSLDRGADVRGRARRDRRDEQSDDRRRGAEEGDGPLARPYLEIVAENPTWTEDEVTWKLNEEMAVRGAEILLPVFEREGGSKGRLSIQTNPKFYRDAARITEQAVHFSTLAPNMQVKVPGTRAGAQAAEDATAAGVTVNVTVCFTVPQAIAMAEAVELGLRRREAAGEDMSLMSPVITMMVGRLDDWLQVLVKRDGIIANPGYVHWAGIACLKNAYPIFQERGYRARLLAAAYRHHLHWSELIGGDIVLTIPHAWQRLFNNSDIEVAPADGEPGGGGGRHRPVRRFADFRRAYDPDGMAPEEFDTTARPCARSAASSPPTRSSSPRSATSCSRTRTCVTGACGRRFWR